MSSEKTPASRLILILGGARSGKSAFAERLAANSRRSVAFIATATADDDEMRERIARHRASRPGEWHTIEEPLDLAGAVRQAHKLADVVLLDCITLWLGNMLLQEPGQVESDDKGKEATGALFDERALKEIEALREAEFETAESAVVALGRLDQTHRHPVARSSRGHAAM